MMKLIGFCIREIGIPFAMDFKHALAARKQTSAVLFEIITDEGIHGYGEGAPRKYVTGESIQSTIKSLQTVAEKLMGFEINPAQNVIEQLETSVKPLFSGNKDTPSAMCAVELALLDAIGKTCKKPVLEFLGSQKITKIEYSCVISDESLSVTKKLLSKIKAFGFQQIKVKVGNDLEANRQKLDLVRSVLGDSIQLRIDANAAWHLEEAILRVNLYHDNYGINIVEQPMPARGRVNYPVLLKEIDSQVKIILDESICTLDDAMWFIENKGATGLNLKISKHGGLLNTLKIYQLARANGLDCQLGCHVGETSILTVAGHIFAGLAGKLFAYEGAFGNLLLTYDVVDHPLQFGPYGKYDLANLMVGPGLGFEINPSLLNKASTSQIYFHGE